MSGCVVSASQLKSQQLLFWSCHFVLMFNNHTERNHFSVLTTVWAEQEVTQTQHTLLTWTCFMNVLMMNKHKSEHCENHIRTTNELHLAQWEIESFGLYYNYHRKQKSSWEERQTLPPHFISSNTCLTSC